MKLKVVLIPVLMIFLAAILAAQPAGVTTPAGNTPVTAEAGIPSSKEKALVKTGIPNDVFFTVADKPWDKGEALVLSWNMPVEVTGLRLQKADSVGVFMDIDVSVGNQGSYTDEGLKANTAESYRMIAFREATGDSLIFSAMASPRENWFYMGKLAYLLILLLISGAIVYYILAARRGKDFFIRRIGGLDSMEEAVGRATEKGRPILFVPGISELDDIQTIASLSILGQLAYRTAEYDTELIVPCRFAMVLSAAREVVKEAYLKAGRPDAYREDRIFYLTDDQFGYVAGIDGIIVREQPAANFFLGSFYAESLILAETGLSTGAIQTAGTANAHQLPFFVVSCDYTLIGEELFAASAYLSRDPQQVGSLKGHDFGKLLVIILILVGMALEIAGIGWFKTFLMGDGA